MPITQILTIIRRKALRLVAALPLLALMLLAATSTAKAQTESLENHAGLVSPIEGSWTFSIHLSQPDTIFTAFASFGAGGVFLATGANDRLVPISPLIGTWKRIRPNRFSSTEYYFVFDSTGHPVATQRANIAFRLINDGSELMGAGETDRCDLDGKNCVRLEGSFEVAATRIMPETSPELVETLPPE
jgi:hypothetical protein